MYYANTADVGIMPQGLYLWVRPFLSQYEPALIPSNELTIPRPPLLALQGAVQLSVGDPPVTTVVFTQRFFERIGPFLDH